MRLIIGLGNPGREYQRTRHNIGFRAVESLADGAVWKMETKFEAEVLKTELFGYETILAKPQTYMNLSGRCVGALARFYKVPPENVIVIQDDIDLPLGTLRIRQGGGSGGHNGIKSITEAIGADFVRVRLGVSNPAYERDAADFVLSRFAPDEAASVEGMIHVVSEIVRLLLEKGLEEAQNRYN